MSDSLPTPITRADYYLATLCGVYSGELPNPITRSECYLATLAGAYSGELPTPITRTDRYLAYLCGVYDSDLPSPITRKDYYLAALCGTYSGDLPTPITREDYYLAQLVADGGVLYEDKTASGVTVEVADAAAQQLNSLTLYGWSTQDGTPTPDNPIDIVSAADSGEVAVTVADGGGNSQTLILTAANGLPGIPVSSGGNYTDANGQQWVADEIVLNADGTGTYRAWVWSTVFNGSENWKVYSNVTYLGFYISPVVPEIMNRREGFCTSLYVDTIGMAISDAVWIGVGSKSFFAICSSYYDADADDYGLSAWKTYLAENPMTMMTYLSEPKETTLTADEVAAFLALKSYNGTTIITNDADAYMDVGYKAKKE